MKGIRWHLQDALDWHLVQSVGFGWVWGPHTTQTQQIGLRISPRMHNVMGNHVYEECGADNQSYLALQWKGTTPIFAFEKVFEMKLWLNAVWGCVISCGAPHYAEAYKSIRECSLAGANQQTTTLYLYNWFLAWNATDSCITCPALISKRFHL